jgi:drug/metabolite transporter (DMT)-like permease
VSIELALLAAATGVLMAIGQVLFKLGAGRLSGDRLPDFLMQTATSPLIIGACVLYALTILLWVWILRQVPLSRVYPFTALAYILTPLFGWLFFQEKVSLQFFLGSVLLLSGILLCAFAEAGGHAAH